MVADSFELIVGTEHLSMLVVSMNCSQFLLVDFGHVIFYFIYFWQFFILPGKYSFFLDL